MKSNIYTSLYQNSLSVMKASRRVATVEEFYSILEQVHSKDCLHAGSKKDICQGLNVPYMHAGDSNCLGSIFVLACS